MSCVNPHRCHRHQQRQRGVPDVVKCGGTAGITCLTLQPVLALVSMNMTFSSLALCSPSSIVICLQEKKSHFTGEALTYTALTCCRCLVHNTQYNSRNDIRNSLSHRFSSRSVLFPTSMMMTSLPLSVLTSSIHFEVCWNEFTSVEGRCVKRRKSAWYSPFTDT